MNRLPVKRYLEINLAQAGVKETIRVFLTLSIVPLLIVTGYRFDKGFRHGETAFKRFIYRLVSTSSANLLAGF